MARTGSAATPFGSPDFVLGPTTPAWEQEGRFGQDLTGRVDLRAGDELRVTCRGDEGSYFSATGTVTH